MRSARAARPSASIWVAAGFVPLVARRPHEQAVSWLALSGIACALQRIAEAGEAQEPELIRTGLFRAR
jgi:hypothetical protein